MFRFIHIGFALLCILYIGLAAYGGYLRYSPVPFADMWDGYLGFYNQLLQGNTSAWWQLHNEHRIVLSRALFWLDLRYFNGAGWILIVANYILVALACWMFWKIYHKLTSNRHNDLWVIFFICSLLFSWGQIDNLTWGFQSQFFFAHLLPLVSFYSLFRYNQKTQNKKQRYLLLACFFGFSSALSMANGILALPLLVLLAIFYRSKASVIIFIISLAIVTITAYFYHYQAPEAHGSVTNALIQSPHKALTFVALYLGSPFFYFCGQNIFAAAIAGLMGGLLMLNSVFLAYQILLKELHNPLRSALLVYLIYLGATALATAAGRLEFGLPVALVSRYVTPALMAWSTIILLNLHYFTKLNQLLRNKLWCIFALILVGMFWHQIKATTPQQTERFTKKVAALSLTLGIKDSARITAIYPFIDHALDLAKTSRDNQISLFGFPEFQHAYEDMNQAHQPINPLTLRTHCSGQIDEVKTLKDDADYLWLKGWLNINSAKPQPTYAQAINSEHKIVGHVILGESLQNTPSQQKKTEFQGYIKADMLSLPIRLIPDNNACSLQTNLELTQPIYTVTKHENFHDGQNSIATPIIVKQARWRDETGELPPPSFFDKDFKLLSSGIETWNKGQITLTLEKGSSILYHSGTMPGRQFVHFPERPDISDTILPIAEQWVLLTFNSERLTEQFTIQIIDKGWRLPEWSAILIPSTNDNTE